MKNIKVLIPVAEVKFEEINMAPWPRDINGKVIGFFWNHKANGDKLLKYIEKALQKKIRLLESLTKDKAQSPPSAAPLELLEELSEKCDLVVLAIGD